MAARTIQSRCARSRRCAATSRTRGPCARSPWPLLVVAAARVPAPRPRVPALGVAARAARPGLALARGGRGRASRPRRRRGPRRAGRPRPRVLFALAAAVVLRRSGLWYASRLRVSGRRAPLPADGAEPLARGRPRPARQPRARGLARGHAGAGGAALRRPARGRPAVPAHSPGLPFLLAPVYALGRPAACACVAAGAGRAPALAVVAWRLAARRAPADRRAGAASPGLAAARPAGRLLRLPRLHRGALGARARAARSRCCWAAPSVRGGRRRRAARLGAALAAREDDPGRGRAGRRRRGPPARPPAAPRSCAVAAAVRRGLSSRTTTPSSGSASPLAIYGGLPPSAAGLAAARPLAGLLLDRSFGLLPARAGLPGRPGRRVPDACAAPAVAARCWSLLAVLAPACSVADVVGRPVPAGALPGPAGAAARRRAWPARRSRVRGPRPRALALAVLAAVGLRARRCSPSRDPGDLLLLNRGDRPTRLWAALSGGRRVGRYLPSLVTGRPGRGPRGGRLGGGARRAARPRRARPARRRAWTAVHRHRACRSCCCLPRGPPWTTGRGPPETASVVSSADVRRGGCHEDAGRHCVARAADRGAQLPAAERDDVLSGGVRMIPITTPKGTFSVWTKRVGKQPDDQGPAAARRARARPTSTSRPSTATSRPRASSTTTTTSSARPTATSPTSRTCGSCRASSTRSSRSARRSGSTRTTSTCSASPGAASWRSSTRSSTSSTSRGWSSRT